jgi:hypothetical protein
MRNKLFAAITLVLIAGAFSVASAQQTTRIKKSTDVTPSWTYKGEWYGFITCNRLQRQGASSTPDQVKKCYTDGGTSILAGGGRTDLEPKEKCAEYAGQQAIVTGMMTSQKYGTGPTSDQSIEGLYAGGDRPATKFEGVKILSVKVMPKDAGAARPADDFGSRVSDKAQQ